MSRAHDMNCEQVRKQAYRYRRGELLGAETSAIEAHTQSCETCRDYYDRLGILLGAASGWQPSDEAGYADALFEGIAARIGQAEADNREDEPEEHSAVTYEDDEDEFGYDDGSRRWVSGVIGLAAGVLLTLGGFYLFQQFQAPQTPVNGSAPTVAHNKKTSVAVRGKDFGELARQESASSQVDVFASDGADWSLSGDEELVLELERGTLLVEFVPEAGRTLRVEAPDFSVRVVGTVFFVSAEKDTPRVGVLAGEVEVSAAGKETKRLTARRELGSGFEPREMPEARIESLSRHVDAEEHLAKLAVLEKKQQDEHGQKRRARRSEKPAPRDSGARNAASSESDTRDEAPEAQARRLPPDLERLRARAERATRRGSYHDAVRYYRSLLDRLPPVHPIAASVHLDLAHIYLHRLNSPGRAEPHLRTFVERWPSDVAAESARRELCKLDASEAGCEVAP